MDHTLSSFFIRLFAPLKQILILQVVCLKCQLSLTLYRPQLLAWETSRANEVTVVTVRPNFQDSVHVGYVCGLKRFTEYYTSVLCFTTPGDGPRSPPQRLRTHEDSKCSHSGQYIVFSDDYMSGCLFITCFLYYYFHSPWCCRTP